MPLKCPNCKRRYADESVYCEECGEGLVPAGPAWRKWAILGLGAVLVVAGVWCGLSYVESDVRENVTADLVDDGTPTFDKLPATIEQRISIQNHSMFNLMLDSLTCQAAFPDRRATCDAVGPTKIPKDSSLTIPFHVEMDRNDGHVDSVPLAEIRVRALGIPISRPFVVRSWPSLKPPIPTKQTNTKNEQPRTTPTDEARKALAAAQKQVSRLKCPPGCKCEKGKFETCPAPN